VRSDAEPSSKSLRDRLRKADGREASLRPGAIELARRDLPERQARRDQIHADRALRRPARELQALSSVPREASTARRLVLLRGVPADAIRTYGGQRSDAEGRRSTHAPVARWRRSPRDRASESAN